MLRVFRLQKEDYARIVKLYPMDGEYPPDFIDRVINQIPCS